MTGDILRATQEYIDQMDGLSLYGVSFNKTNHTKERSPSDFKLTKKKHGNKSTFTLLKAGIVKEKKFHHI